MVIETDGEKYACDACVRGHRVSSCSHKDRHLNHINRKGRPVSQCPHCRSLRKNRASHVKCVCAELGLARPEAGSAKDANACHCCHGQPCTCAAKREAYAAEHLSSSAASSNHPPHRRSLSKPNATSRRSDSIVSKYPHGHHPPLHRFNNAAHEYSPYPTHRSQTTSGPINISQRSADNLSLGMHSGGTGIYSTSPSSLPMASCMNNGNGALGSGNALASASVPSGLKNLAGSDAFGGDVPTYASGTRWSMTDFSAMSNYASFASEPYRNQDPSSALSTDQQFNWADWDFDGATATGGMQPAGSVASVDHPGLSRSSSGTASDTGESSFNPAEVAFPSMPVPTMTSNDAVWALDDSWPIDTSGLQDKTPLAMPSQSTGSATGMELGDYFGDFRQAGVTFGSAPGPMDEAISYASAPASLYEGVMPDMSMPPMSEAAAGAWSPSGQMAQAKTESQVQQGPPYHDPGWL